MIRQLLRMKKTIVFGVLALWTTLFCLSFCDEMGFWVDVGKAADQAVEQILVSPNIKVSSTLTHQDNLQHPIMLVSIHVILDTDSNSLITFYQDYSQPLSRPPLFQLYSHLLI